MIRGYVKEKKIPNILGGHMNEEKALTFEAVTHKISSTGTRAP